MTEVATGRDVWPAISKVLAASGPRRCAVAYLGAAAGDLLHDLRRGDLVVCDASPHALKSGATHPDALQALLDRNVTVRSLPRMHAKIYIAGAAAFVGSANASATATGNDEAGVTLSGTRAVSQLADYVDALAMDADATRVDARFVEFARALYRPPRGGEGGGSRSGPPVRLLHFWDFGDVAPAMVAKAAKAQLAKWGDESDEAATLDWSWGAKGAWSVGATCVWVERGRSSNSDKWLADPPATCVHRHPAARSTQWVYWWRTPAANPLRWDALRHHVLTRSGVTLELRTRTRRAVTVDAVYGAFGLSREDAPGAAHGV